MSNAPFSFDVVNNAWKVSSARTQTDLYRLRRSSMLVPMLLMQQAAGATNNKFQFQGVVDIIGDPAFGDKRGKAVKIRYRKQSEYTDGEFNPNGGACNPEAGTTSWVTQQYNINRTVPHSVRIDLNKYRCEDVDGAAEAQQDIAQAFADIEDLFNIAVEQELYAGYIGKLPSLQGGTVQTPRDFATLPLYRANGVELNEGAEGVVQLDMIQANANDYMSVVADRGWKYARQKDATRVNDRGTDFTALADVVGSDYVYSPFLNGNIKSATYGVTNGSPMLVIERGAVYIASAPYFRDAVKDGFPRVNDEPGVRRYSVLHPTLPGIWVNIVEKVETQCENFHELPKVLIEMTINYTIVAKGGYQCDYQKGNNSKGNNGIYLYFITCEDEGACSREEYSTVLPSRVYPFQENCVSENECPAAFACQTSVQPQAIVAVGDETFLSFTAFVTASGGATNPTAYDWFIDGVFYQSTGAPILLIPVNDLVEGQVVTMAAKDSLDCDIAGSWEVTLAGACGALRFTYDGVTYTGDEITLELGDLSQTGAGVTTPIAATILAVDYDNTASISATADAVVTASLSASDVPVSGTPVTLTANLKTEGLGAASAVVELLDACGNEYTITYNFTVVA